MIYLICTWGGLRNTLFFFCCEELKQTLSEIVEDLLDYSSLFLLQISIDNLLLVYSEESYSLLFLSQIANVWYLIYSRTAGSFLRETP